VVIPPWVDGNCPDLVPPFTWFGGKRWITRFVWQQFGADIENYIEPFAGGLAVLLARPVTDMNVFKRCAEMFNDKNSFLLNFWRTVQYGNIKKLVRYADFPSYEEEQLARRRFLMNRLTGLDENISRDHNFFDVEIAGLWLYVTRNWIGGGADDPAQSPDNKMPRKKISGWQGGSAEKHLACLQKRLKNATGFRGDWQRVVKSKTQTTSFKNTGVFLDPPYRGTEEYYAGTGEGRLPERSSIADEVDNWALSKQRDHKKFRIAVCGYQHNFKNEEYKAAGWHLQQWEARIGMGSIKKDQFSREDKIEIIAFSPGCLFPEEIR